MLTSVSPVIALPITIGDALYDKIGTSEIVTAAFIQPNGGISVGTYSNFVLLSVSSIGWSLGSNFNDAFYLFTGPQTPAHNQQHHQLVFDTQPLERNNPARNAKNFIVYDMDQNTEVSATPYVPSYNPDHLYNFVTDLGTSVPNHFYFGVSDGDFYDNGGAFSIEISQLKVVSEPVPEPTTIFLFGAGLIGLVGFRRKFRMKLK